ncbi:MAG TPA: YIP1 family protein [Candidatus Nanoarchaeia archaeon]|nr:YIP1 family protein [Candidatus Nanoarchaeia archaeon]
MAIQQKNYKPVSGVKFKNYFDKLGKLFFKPSTFFKGVANEQNYFPILIFFVIVSAIAYIINWILTVIQAFSTPEATSAAVLGVIFGFFGVAFSVGLSFAIPFVTAGIVHLGVMIYGGKKGYFNTFKPETYAMVVGMIYGIIFYIANFILWIVQPFQITEAAATSLTSILNSIPVSYYVVNILIFIISLIHTLCVEVIGISKFQEMGKGRSFLAIITPRIILFLVIVIPLILLFQFILSVSQGAVA